MRACVLGLSASLAILIGVLFPEPAVTAVPEKELAWSFQYDGAGRLTEARDPGGLVTKIGYKFAGPRLQQVTRTANDASQVVLDLQGDRRAAMTDPLGKTSYKYDARGRLKTVQRDGTEIAYRHDEADRLTEVKVAGKWTTRYHYDYLGRPTRIETPAGEIKVRAKVRQVEITLPNGVRTVRASNPDGTLASVTHTAKDGTELATFAYRYNLDRLVMEVTETTPAGKRTLSYRYDSGRRLEEVTDSQTGKTTFAYDATGNRLSVTTPDGKTVAAYDWQDRLTTLRGAAVAHDPSGNVTGYAGARGPVAVKYDALGQVAGVTMKDAAITYAHDGDGKLIARTVGDRKTNYVPDPLAHTWQPLLETDADGKQTYHVWLGDTPLATVSAAGTHFYLGDHLSSVRALVDDKGKVTERIEVGPFGEVATPAGGPRPAFAGMFYDADAGLYLTLARVYDPTLGRFLQRDPQHRMPFGSQKDLSAYAYCGDDPVNFVDRDGCQPLPPPPPFLMDQNRFGIRPPRIDVFGDRREPGPTVSERLVRFDNIVHQGGARLADRLYNNGTWYGRVGGVLVDVGAGIIPGQPASPIQATSNFVTSVGTSFVPFVGVAYNGASLGMNVARGDRDGIILDAVGMIPGGKGVTAFGESVLRTPRLGSQIDRLGNLTDTIQFSGDIYRLRPETALFDGIRLGSSDRGSATARLTIPPLRNDNRYIPFPPPPGGPGAAVPSNIGGVALAGGDIKGLGQLQGMALDENGRITLITGPEGATKIALPGLRLDDVVTIFKCVYDQGTAPFVSIDPDPQAPRGKTMNVRHDKGTVGSYVGWVLFEADRVMKIYTLGVDNLAPFPGVVRSKLRDYRNIPDLAAGFGEAVNQNQWERFWIKVEEVVFRTDTTGQVTLGEVKLRLDTETMVFDAAKKALIPAPNAKPKRSSATFAEWFTKNYKKIDEERTSTPPDKTATVAKNVAIFAELERMALIAALAERLRGQGVPLPSWMRDYPVQPFAVPATTPTVTGRDRTNRILVFGGAVLGDGKVTLKANDPAANALAESVRTALADQPSGAVVPFQSGTQKLAALPLPGENAQALGGNILAETDLTVPFADTELRLTRKFNSFVATKDAFGPAWTFDLPRLEEARWQKERTGDSVLYTKGHRLTLPLHGLTETFKDIGPVDTPLVRGKIYVPQSANSPIIGLASAKDEDAPGARYVVFFHSGQQWYFNEARQFVALKEGTVSFRYHYNGDQLVKLEGHEGDLLRATISLEYEAGKLLRASTGDRSVTYGYSKEGLLSAVTGAAGKVGYTYTKGQQVASIQHDGQSVREFTYGPGGRLTSEKDAEGNEVKVNVTGNTVTVGNSSATYDARMRPVARTDADGTRTQWERTKTGDVTTTVTPVGDESRRYQVVRQGDRATLALADGSKYVATFDKDDRLTEVKLGDKVLLTQNFDALGRLTSASDGTTSLDQRYRTGVLAERTIKAVGGDDWLRITYDANGRPAKVTDSDGATTTFAYGKDGRLGQLVSDGVAVALERDPGGRVTTETTTWGEVRKTTFAGPQVARVEVSREKKTASIEFTGGKPTQVTDFGARTSSFAYHKAGAFRDRLKEVRTASGLVLEYGYAANDRSLTVTSPLHWQLVYTFDGGGRLLGITQKPLAP